MKYKESLMDKKTHYGVTVDLTAREALEALKGETHVEHAEHPYRTNRLFVKFRGEIFEVARTDLMDDVCTTYVNQKPADELLAHFVAKCNFGARLKRHADGRKTFAVIDSFSDG